MTKICIRSKKLSQSNYLSSLLTLKSSNRSREGKALSQIAHSFYTTQVFDKTRHSFGRTILNSLNLVYSLSCTGAQLSKSAKRKLIYVGLQNRQ
jgi:hypothetical protein